MESFAHVAGIALLLAGCLLSLASLVVGIPGTWIVVALALLYAWLTGFAAVTWGTIGWLALLAAVGEVLELAATAFAAPGEGPRPSRRATIAAIVGAVVGGILGTPILFGLGALLGALAGAFAGAALAVASEGGSAAHAWSTGLAAMKGRFLGFVLKAAVAVTMIVVLAAAAI